MTVFEPCKLVATLLWGLIVATDCRSAAQVVQVVNPMHNNNILIMMSLRLIGLSEQLRHFKKTGLLTLLFVREYRYLP
jgi:hypothetical protein